MLVDCSIMPTTPIILYRHSIIPPTRSPWPSPPARPPTLPKRIDRKAKASRAGPSAGRLPSNGSTCSSTISACIRNIQFA